MKKENGTSLVILKKTKEKQEDMYADEIKTLIERFPQIARHFKAICAIDKIPRKLSELDFVVANTE